MARKVAARHWRPERRAGPLGGRGRRRRDRHAPARVACSLWLRLGWSRPTRSWPIARQSRRLRPACVWMSRRNEHGTRALMQAAPAPASVASTGPSTRSRDLLSRAYTGNDAQMTQSGDELRADALELSADPLAVAEAIRSARTAATPPAGDRLPAPHAGCPARAWRHPGRGARSADPAAAHRPPRPSPGQPAAGDRPQRRDGGGLLRGAGRDRRRLQLAKPADVFPFASSTSRRLDRDHTRAYDVDGPPGQTVETNLGKLTRHHHRIKTHGGWSVEQRDRRFTWTSPHGRVYVTDGQGTHTRRAAGGRGCRTSSGRLRPSG